MLFAPDVAEALGAAVELVNSDEIDSLPTASAFFDRWGYTGTRPSSLSDVADLLDVRPRLRALFTCDRDDLVILINEILREQHAVPQLVRHDHLDWHIHAVSEDRPWHERILVETAMALVDLVRADELDRLRTCAAGGCEGIVLDLSRNRSRRYCSTTCGNREAQAAHRARTTGQHRAP